VSGQRINRSKTQVITPDYFTDKRKEVIHQITGFSIGQLPLKYLGALIFKGKANQAMFEELKIRIVKRLDGWKVKTFSTGGRITLIKSVIYSIPMHILAVLKPPKGVLEYIQKRILQFLWGNKHQWVAQNVVCKDRNQGGIGIDNLTQILDSMHQKLTWKYICNDTLWAQFLQEKYGEPNEVINNPIHTSCSHIWPLIYQRLLNLLDQVCWQDRDGVQTTVWMPNWLGKFSVKQWKRNN